MQTVNQPYIRFFQDLGIENVAEVGGKNASLGEMISQLGKKGVQIPGGFATTSQAYWDFLDANGLKKPLQDLMDQLDRKNYNNLNQIGKKARQLISEAPLPDNLQEAIKKAYQKFCRETNEEPEMAVRSSATAEDLPSASFAGQHESFLNVEGEEALIKTCKQCFASLFTNRAIKYREHNGFKHMEVALSVGFQKMVRSDLASSGVGFTMDPETGFRNVVLLTGSWGLGENVVQGAVNPDEYYVFKPSLKAEKQAIITKNLGSKTKTMVYAETDKTDVRGITTVNVDTPVEKQEKYVISDEEANTIATWGVIIEEHYQKPMDFEWAKDGKTGELYIVQARPETVYTSRKPQVKFKNYQLKSKGDIIVKGSGIGESITAGRARILHSPNDSDKIKEGDILVTEITNPDWDPILKKASAIITDRGGRTSHAAIVAREMGAVAVVGAGNATKLIEDGQKVTVSCAEGQEGVVYDGILDWEENWIDFSELNKPDTQVMMILADPGKAFEYSFYPIDGVGLMRLEFVINNTIKIHPNALVYFDKIKDLHTRETIEKLTHHFPDKKQYFVEKLGQAVAMVAAAFYPREVIVRMSDFKTNEYANLIGGRNFEPNEENPMLGFRGASRYYSDQYKEGFRLECEAMKMVSEDMGLDNVKLMIPFCRTVEEGKKVIEIMENFGLKRGKNGLQIYVMAEIPSNVMLAEEFASVFDGFSIGSNDLTQLTLGIDRDSSTVNFLFDERNEASKKMIQMMIRKAITAKKPIGLCGQAPSDFPEMASFLVEEGITSISFNPDALYKGIKNILEAEEKKIIKT